MQRTIGTNFTFDTRLALLVSTFYTSSATVLPPSRFHMLRFIPEIGRFREELLLATEVDIKLLSLESVCIVDVP